MPLGLLLANVVSVSTSLGALLALGVLFFHLHSRGVLLLAAAVALLTVDYVLGLLLFAPADSPLLAGPSALPAAGARAAVVFGLKGICHVGGLATAPLAVLLLLGASPGRLALGVGAGAAAAALAADVGLMAGVLPLDPVVVLATTAAPAYAAYALSLAILVRRRKAVARPALARSIARAATIALAVIVPGLLAADILAFLGVLPTALPLDAVAFSVLTGGILVSSLLVLLGSRRRPSGAEVDGFCAEHALSVRERDVLLLLGEGLRYKQIAERLCISLDTVKTHVSRIYRKTSATGKTDLFYRIRLRGP